MREKARVTYRAGRNLAMKVPPDQFEATIAFYRDVLGLPHLGSQEDSVSVAFGSFRLAIDRVETVSQAEIWLEVQTDDTEKASSHLEASGVVRCDEIERLPDDLDGFWIKNPAGIVHLVDRVEKDS